MDNLDLLAKKLYAKFLVIWGEKFARIFNDEGMYEAWIAEWKTILVSFDIETIIKGADYCRDSYEWPPSIAEFIKACLKVSNALTPRDIMQIALRGDFSNPLVKKIYEKIGSHDFRMRPEKEVIKNIADVLQDCMFEMRQEQLLKDDRRLKLIG